MQIINGRVEAPLTVQAALEVRGMVTGQIDVTNGADFVLRGVCEGDVVIASEARAQLWGLVKGNVLNRGGVVSIFGMVEGRVETEAGKTTISPDSIVRRGIVP